MGSLWRTKANTVNRCARVAQLCWVGNSDIDPHLKPRVNAVLVTASQVMGSVPLIGLKWFSVRCNPT